ncbi:MAG: glycosyltransferase [Nitrospirae bacterium]|nr:glycosyltransferase [Nitrospirota bacterium]
MQEINREKKIKVLHIHASAEIGGAENITFELLRKTDKGAFDVRVLFDCIKGPIMSYYHKEGIEIFESTGILKDIRFILAFKPDIIHLYGLRTNLKWRPILMLLGFRNVIGAMMGLTNTEKIGFWRIKLDVWTSCLLKKYVTNSRKVADYLKDRGFPEEKLEIIYNGIETGKFRALQETEKEQIKKRLGIPPDSVVISCVGNLRIVKGHGFLIDALSILKRLNFSALMIGDGDLKDTLIKISLEKGIKVKVHFP